MEKIWLKQYPAGVPAEIDVEQYASLVALLDESFRRYADALAYKFMGKAISFAQVDEASRALAAYLQALGLAKGDRVAVMMPNVPQYPVAVAAILRAGYVVVNVNPLYTPRELEHQLKDSGAKAILILENFAERAAAGDRPRCRRKKIVLAAIGDMLGFPKSLIVNYVVRKVKKMVPAFDLPGAVRFNDAIAQGRGKTFKPASVGPDDIAVLQYTGGTTGVSKGAVLLHRNLVANILQSEAWYQPALKKIPAGEQVVTICALPIYHIFGFNTNMMLGMRMGGANILIPNPRDLPAMFKELQRREVPQLPGRQHAVQRDGEPPRLRHGRLERPGDLGRRRHGGAERDREALAREDRLPDRRGLRPVGDLAVGDLQSGRQHRVQRQHRPADAQHRAQAARRRRQRGAGRRRRARSRSGARR